MFGFSGIRSDEDKVQEAKSRLAGLPHISQETWKQMLTKHGWLFGSMSAKIKVIGFLTPKANDAAKNVLFGSPTHKGDMVCKTILVPDSTNQTWNLAAKLRIAYGISEPNRYRTPAIILDETKHITQKQAGAFEKEWKALPEELRKRATDEFESCVELAKSVKVDTFYVILPNDEIVEVGHPFNVEKVWNDYLSSKS